MKRVVRRDALNKSEFHVRLRQFLRDTNDRTVGAADVGVTAWVYVVHGNQIFKLHSDAGRSAVSAYLDLVEQHGDCLEWTIVPNQRGRKNAVAYGPTQLRLSSFYFYLVNDQASCGDTSDAVPVEANRIANDFYTGKEFLGIDLSLANSPMPGEKNFTRHPDADQQIASAITVIKVLLPLRLYPGHLKQFLSRALWKITEAEGGGKSGKYRIRYRSLASLSAPQKELRHEHVYQQDKMINELIAHPDRVEDIVNKAVACVVTKDEHLRLDAVGNGFYGWARYIRAQIAVVDTATGETADLRRLAENADALMSYRPSESNAGVG